MPKSDATLRAYLLTKKFAPAKKFIPPFFQTEDATFYREHLSAATTASNCPPQLANWTFSLPFIDQRITPRDRELWAIVGPGKSGKTFLLETILGKHVCQPPNARRWPALSTEVPDSFSEFRDPTRAIEYVGFDPKKGALGISSLRASHGSARYESNREITDFTLQDYLLGNLSLNAAEVTADQRDIFRSKHLMKQLRLNDLLQLPVTFLSNGQTRRARIAKALIKEPLLLLLDEPFTGLDPYAKEEISDTLGQLARQWKPSIILALQDEAALPSWITHLVYINGPGRVVAQGRRSKVLQSIYAERLSRNRASHRNFNPSNSQGLYSGELAGTESRESSMENLAPFVGRDEDFEDVIGDFDELSSGKFEDSLSPFLAIDRELEEDEYEAEDPIALGKLKPHRDIRWDIAPALTARELEGLDPTPLISIKGAVINYGQSKIFNFREKGIGRSSPDRVGLWFDLKRGDRVGLFGPNGCGKTTMVALMTSDHPQAYSQPVEIFGKPRLPAPGQPGISVFDIQARMGVASPEVHNLLPRGMTLRAVLESAWAEATMAKPVLTASIDATVDAHLRWFRNEFDDSVGSQRILDTLHNYWASFYTSDNPRLEKLRTERYIAYKDQDISYADRLTFGQMSFSCQRLALFLRAIIKKPDIVVLDEAFSGMDENMRVKAMMFLTYGETMWLRKYLTLKSANQDYASRSLMKSIIAMEKDVIVTGLEPRQGLLAVAHRPEEVPPALTKYIRLPERSQSQKSQRNPKEGRIRRWNTRYSRFKAENPGWWDEIWGRQPGMTGLVPVER